MKLKTQKQYLEWYHKNIQKDIVLVSRLNQHESWAKRCIYLSPKYTSTLEYNHRSVLTNEVIIEYDEEDFELNRKLAEKVVAKLNKDGIQWCKWKSGGKSVHLHCLFSFETARNIPLLKKVIMRHYGTFWYDNITGKIYDTEMKGDNFRQILPDLRLADNGHLIRLEYAIHEKSQRYKSYMSSSKNYPWRSKLPQEVWDKYIKEFKIVVARRMTIDTKDVENSELVQKILDTTRFREDIGDGRERVMFALIHILKKKYPVQEDMAKYLWDWYHYSSGTKMTYQDVYRKVKYHFNRQYCIGIPYLQRIIDEVSSK